MSDILQYTAVMLSEQIKAGKVTVREALDAVMAQIEKREEKLHCYVTIDKEGAYAQADRVQALIDEGKLSGPLAGVPFAIKDNMCTEGL